MHSGREVVSHVACRHGGPPPLPAFSIDSSNVPIEISSFYNPPDLAWILDRSWGKRRLGEKSRVKTRKGASICDIRDIFGIF